MKNRVKLGLGVLTVLSTPLVVGEIAENNEAYAVSHNPGWQKDTAGVWYYYTTGGKQVRNAWVGDYYLGSNGKMAVNRWIDSKYYVGADGKWIPN